jgi:broad specificity phosphatase PhoE
MKNKDIYFIRHGQSVGNVKKEFQGHDDPLSELGRKQVKYVAKRVRNLNAETILTSPMARAFETAEAIKKEIDVPLETHDFLKECSAPSKLVGKKYNSPEGKKYTNFLFENIHDKNWRYSDEENFSDISDRAKKVVKHLESREEETMIVVTHGAFMRSILSIMMSEGEEDALLSLRMIRFFEHKNTGITLCKYTPNESTHNKWRMLAWNDHAHLGEVTEDEPKT